MLDLTLWKVKETNKSSFMNNQTDFVDDNDEFNSISIPMMLAEKEHEM
jgi:hypothetical protein